MQLLSISSSHQRVEIRRLLSFLIAPNFYENFISELLVKSLMNRPESKLPDCL